MKGFLPTILIVYQLLLGFSWSFANAEASSLAEGEATQSEESVNVAGFFSSDFARDMFGMGDSEVGKARKKQKEELEKILKEYGNPGEAPALNVVDKAPKPFKAMMAALDAGEDQLAYQYANQYVRYLSDLNERTSRIVGLTGQAMEHQGVLAKGEWQSSDLYANESELVKEHLAMLQAKGEDLPKTLLDQAKAQALKGKVNASNPSNSEQEPGFDEKAERAKVRAAVFQSVPRDSRGMVDVYFFFRPKDRDSQLMFYEVEKLYQQNRNNPSMNFIGLSLDRLSAADLSNLQRAYGVSFPIKGGSKLAKQFEVKVLPTTVLVAHTDGKAVVEEGYRRYFYVDELVKIIEGR